MAPNNSLKHLSEINGYDKIEEELLELKSRYDILELIGRGSFGMVLSAHDKQNNRFVAMKIIAGRRNYRQMTAIFQEIAFLKKLDHPNIIKLFNVIISAHIDDVLIMTEIMDIDLNNLIRAKTHKFKTKTLKFLMYQIVDAVNYIHSANIIHRDLKPSNIFINRRSKEIRIGDFGLACVNERNVNAIHHNVVGTVPYRAPELYATKGKYNESVDMWAIGCIFGECLQRSIIFPARNHAELFKLHIGFVGTDPKKENYSFVESQYIRNVIRQQGYSAPQMDIVYSKSDPLELDLMKRLLAFNPQKRITAEEMLQSEYFKKSTSLTLASSTKIQPFGKDDIPRTNRCRFQMKRKLIETFKL